MNNEELFENGIDFINNMYGYYMRLKEIHWINRNGNIHQVMDTLSWNIINRMDEVMEIVLSFVGREQFEYGRLLPNIVLLDCTDPENVVNGINEVLVNYRRTIPEDEKFNGLRSTIDNMIAEVNIETYRTKIN